MGAPGAIRSSRCTSTLSRLRSPITPASPFTQVTLNSRAINIRATPRNPLTLAIRLSLATRASPTLRVTRSSQAINTRAIPRHPHTRVTRLNPLTLAILSSLVTNILVTPRNRATLVIRSIQAIRGHR